MDIESKLSKFRRETQFKNISNNEQSSILNNFKSIFNKYSINLSPPTTTTEESRNQKIQYESKNANRLKYLRKNNKSSEDFNSVQMSSSASSSTGDNEEEEEVEEIDMKLRILKILIKFCLWVTLLAFFIKLEFGTVYFVISLIVLIYLNTGTNRRKSNKLSAYSVFNPNLEQIQGTITPEKLQSTMLPSLF
jgi:hypothetical protein